MYLFLFSVSEQNDIHPLRYRLVNALYQLIIEVKQVHSKAAAVGATKVKIVPLTLFSDGTSGNATKKWNAYDSWITLPAVMTLK